MQALADFDTPPNPRSDTMGAEVAERFSTNASATALIDNDRQWFRLRLGLDVTETPLDIRSARL